jgi:catechol 1,2-dioxygenase
MIIANEAEVTPAVLGELERIEDPRLREIAAAAVRHLHAFAREVRLTEPEFQQACRWLARLGQATTPDHNEVVLAAGSVGLSTLVCLLNNGVNDTRTEDATTANLLGPFWRQGSPPTPNGGSIVRSPTPGPALLVSARVLDAGGQPVPDAGVDVWQSSPEGFYESQDSGQADMNLRGNFATDRRGVFRFRSVLPAGYPIPVSGPVGDLLRAAGRHNMRPAHLHFLISKPGYKTHISQVYVQDDPNLETDVQFGVTRATIGDYVRHDEPPPEADIEAPWYSLDYTFRIERGQTGLPPPPVTSKSDGPRPVRTVLERRK